MGLCDELRLQYCGCPCPPAGPSPPTPTTPNHSLGATSRRSSLTCRCCGAHRALADGGPGMPERHLPRRGSTSSHTWRSVAGERDSKGPPGSAQCTRDPQAAGKQLLHHQLLCSSETRHTVTPHGSRTCEHGGVCRRGWGSKEPRGKCSRAGLGRRGFARRGQGGVGHSAPRQRVVRPTALGPRPRDSGAGDKDLTGGGSSPSGD